MCLPKARMRQPVISNPRCAEVQNKIVEQSHTAKNARNEFDSLALARCDASFDPCKLLMCNRLKLNCFIVGLGCGIAETPGRQLRSKAARERAKRIA